MAYYIEEEVLLHRNPETGRHSFCIVKSWCPLTLMKASQAPNLGWHANRLTSPFRAEKKDVQETYRCPVKKNQYSVSYQKRTLAPKGRNTQLEKHEGEEVTILAALDLEETESDGIVRYLVRLRSGRLAIACDDELVKTTSHEREKERKKEASR